MGDEVSSKENREDFPTLAGIIDQFKDVFGADQVKVRYVEENGKSLGKRPDDWGDEDELP